MSTSYKAIVCAMFAAAIGATTSHAETYTYATHKPQGSDAHARSLEWLVDEFSKRTGGQHELEIFWGGSVVSVGEAPDAIGSGVVAFGDIVTPYFPDLLPVNNAVGFFIPQPMDPHGVGASMYKWHEEFEPFEQELTELNIHAFGFRPLGSYGLLCKEPIRSLADLQGKRVRSYGAAYPALIEAMGATPVSVPSTETYEALERSILDCTPTDLSQAHGIKYDEVAPYWVQVPFGASFGHLLAVNLDVYNAMDEETRAVVDEIGADYLDYYTELMANLEADVLKTWEEEGTVEVIEFPRDELAPLVEDERVQAVRNGWIEKVQSKGLETDAVVNDLTF